MIVATTSPVHPGGVELKTVIAGVINDGKESLKSLLEKKSNYIFDLHLQLLGMDSESRLHNAPQSSASNLRNPKVNALDQHPDRKCKECGQYNIREIYHCSRCLVYSF